MEKETLICRIADVTTELKIDLQVIESAEDFDAILTWWQPFLARPTVVAGFFTDPSVLKHDAGFESGGSLVIGKVCRNGDLVAIVPLIVRKRQIPVRLGLIPLLKPVARVAKIPDFEFPREKALDPFEVFSAILSAFRQQLQLADIVTVDSAPEPPAGFSISNFTVNDVQTTYVFEVVGDFASYEEKLTSNSRRRVKKKVRLFDKAAGASVRAICYRTPEEMDMLRVQFRKVWEKSWHAHVGHEHIPSESFLKTLAQSGSIRSYALLVGEQPISYFLGFQYRGTYYLERTAYDEEWRDHSPGIVLLFNILKDLFKTDRPVRVDFGSGYNEYKQVFGTQEERRGSIRVGITMKGRLIVFFQTSLNAVFKWSKVALDRTGLPRWIRMKVRKEK